MTYDLEVKFLADAVSQHGEQRTEDFSDRLINMDLRYFTFPCDLDLNPYITMKFLGGTVCQHVIVDQQYGVIFLSDRFMNTALRGFPVFRSQLTS